MTAEPTKATLCGFPVAFTDELPAAPKLQAMDKIRESRGLDKQAGDKFTHVNESIEEAKAEAQKNLDRMIEMMRNGGKTPKTLTEREHAILNGTEVKIAAKPIEMDFSESDRLVFPKETASAAAYWVGEKEEVKDPSPSPIDCSEPLTETPADPFSRWAKKCE